VFRRRKSAEGDPGDGTVDVDRGVAESEGRHDGLEGDPTSPVVRHPTSVRTDGPYDAADAPAEDNVALIDLGGIRIPVPEGVELRVEVDQESGAVTSAVVVQGESVLQVGAFAAPRGDGLWTEVTNEISAGIREAGGSVEPATGPFGRELRATVPVEVPGQPRTMQPARFLGVDGPRWFLRGLMQGPAAATPTAGAVFEAVFRGIVVVRGGEAMAPRDPLPLRIPRDLADSAGAPQLAEPDTSEPEQRQQYTDADLDPFARGPEITEIR
jgi:uncharacterized protein DUF3710